MPLYAIKLDIVLIWTVITAFVASDQLLDG